MYRKRFMVRPRRASRRPHCVALWARRLCNDHWHPARVDSDSNGAALGLPLWKRSCPPSGDGDALTFDKERSENLSGVAFLFLHQLFWRPFSNQGSTEVPALWSKIHDPVG